MTLDGRLSLDVGGVFLPVPSTYVAVAGARLFLLEHQLSPYVMARAGKFHRDLEESGTFGLSFFVIGAGLEYATSVGITPWIELGVGQASDIDPRGSGGCLYVSLGLAYRFAVNSPRGGT